MKWSLLVIIFVCILSCSPSKSEKEEKTDFNTPTYTEEEINASYKLGFSYYKSGKFLKADSCYIPSDNCLHQYWKALTKYEIGDYLGAKELFLSALNCDLPTKDSTISHVQPYLDLANTYAKLKDTPAAIRYFNKTLDSVQPNTIMEARTYSNLAQYYSDIQEYDSALIYFNKITHHPYIDSIEAHWLNCGLAYKRLALQNKGANIELAKELFEKSRVCTLKEYHIRSKQEDSLNMAIACNNLGFCFKDDNQLDNAMYYFRLAKKHLTTYNTTKTIVSFRSLEALIRNYSGVAKTNIEKYKISTLPADLDSALFYFHRIPAYMHEMRKTLGSEESKSVFTDLLYGVYEPALETIFSASNSYSYIQYACDFIEAGKSLALLEDIQDKTALSNGQIPADLLNKKDNLQKQIIDIKGQIERKGNIELYQGKVRLESELGLLIHQIEKDYPNYYQLKYPNTAVDINAIRTKCSKENSVFIDFFQGKNSVYILYITPTHQGLLKKDITDVDLSEQTQDLRKYLDSIGSGNSRCMPTFKRKSNLLYQSLFADLDSIFQKRGMPFPIKTTLVLDGHLHKIPFDALLCDTLKNQYLIEKYNFSLAHSAAMYLQNYGKAAQNNEILAFSPVFNADYDKQFPIPHQNENPLIQTYYLLNQLSKEYGVEVYLYEKANSENFRKKAGKYGIIHLATHAVANDSIPEKSYIAFAPNLIGDSTNRGYFYMSDVYGTSLQSELALLTACETGKGLVKKGEGTMSLARAFKYAGCERIIMTLWSVDEGSTMEITKYFYDNLAKGESYGDALYKAKLQLKSQSPNKWAALVLIGDANGSFPLKKRNSWISIALLGLGGLILLGIGYFLYHRKRNL